MMLPSSRTIHPERQQWAALLRRKREASASKQDRVEKDFHHYDWLRKEKGEASIEYYGSNDEDDEFFGDFRRDVYGYVPLSPAATHDDGDERSTREHASAAMNLSPITHPSAFSPQTTDVQFNNLEDEPPRRLGNASSALYTSFSTKLQKQKTHVKALSSTSTTNNADEEQVLVRVGPFQHEFRHSKTMLCYASDVLARQLRPMDANSKQESSIWWVLDIPHRSHVEWRRLQAFLQPRSVQAASISPRNLPTLLPWFHELQLSVLLAECDVLLSSLEWPVAVTSHSSQCPNLVEDDHERRHSSNEPQRKDVHDVLTLTKIANRAYLPATRKKCMTLLASYLEWQPQLFVDIPSSKDDCHGFGPNECTDMGENCADHKKLNKPDMKSSDESDTSLDLLQSLANVLLGADARQVLWRSIISYLPADLQVFTDQDVLVQNPLFPYLLREGLEKHVVARRNEKQNLQKFLPFLLNRTDYSFDGTREDGARKGPKPNDSSTEHQELCSTHSFESLHNVFERWWVSWSIPEPDHHISRAHSDITERVSKDRIKEKFRRKRRLHQKHEKGAPSSALLRTGVTLDGVPQDRSSWLELIWQKLKEPPIFPQPDENFSDLSAVVTPTSQGRPHRTFVC